MVKTYLNMYTALKTTIELIILTNSLMKNSLTTILCFGTNNSDSGSSDKDEIDDGSIEKAKDFILCFFCRLSSDKSEQLHKEEALFIIPDYNNEQLVHCPGLIQGAPKGKSKVD